MHSHTWYANGAGHLAKLLHGVPHVVTAHCLEPLRPWKAEQLGGGYRVSSWIEKTAFESADTVIAVSEGMRRDILASTRRSTRRGSSRSTTASTSTLAAARRRRAARASASTRTGPPSSSSAASPARRVCRICSAQRAGCRRRCRSPLRGRSRHPEILAEVTGLVEQLQPERDGVVWIDRLLPQRRVADRLTASTVFVCPSIYEPLGIVNLEAMACGLPVVGTATGGIPEVDRRRLDRSPCAIQQLQDGTGTPTDPERFVDDLAAALIEVVSDPERAAGWAWRAESAPRTRSAGRPSPRRPGTSIAHWCH